MIKLMKVSNFLDEPRYPCLGPNIRFLSFLGLWHSDLKSTVTRMKLAFFYLTIAFLLTQYMKCLILFDTDSLKLVLKYVPFHLGVIKTCLFQKQYKRWEHLLKYISTLELQQISKKDEKQNGILSNYIKRSRKIMYLFFAFAFFANISVFTEPYQKNQVSVNGTSVYVYMFDGYTPFAREPPGYYCSMFIQTVVGYMMSACIVSWDMLVISIMIFFAGQLRMSGLYCKRAIDSKNARKSRRNIAECHQFHISLVRYQREFNDLISPIMFIYFNVTCTCLGFNIKQLAEIEDDFATLISGCIYIQANLIQLLLFYWHANEVTVQSELVRYSSFESNWMSADKNTQKDISILAQTTSTRLKFQAGPFHEMSLRTFIGILRTSYSFYTLMKGTN